VIQKVIGINLLFVGEKNLKCDSILQASIITSDGVVLLEAFKGEEIIGSHERFRRL